MKTGNRESFGNVEIQVQQALPQQKVVKTLEYPKNYMPKNIEHQIRKMGRVFKLKTTESLNFSKKLPPLPSGAEGFFAIPSINALARKHFPNVIDFNERYRKALRLVLRKIESSRLLESSLRDPEQKYLKLCPRALRAFTVISNRQQEGEIWIIAAQTGKKYRGDGDWYLQKNEFCLDLFSLGCMLLTHPERESYIDHLHLNCLGSRVSPALDEKDNFFPFFRFNGRSLKLGIAWEKDADNPEFGIATGFLY